MAVAQNGWPASPSKDEIRVADFTIEGVAFPGGVKRGDVATVLEYVARQFHQRVEPLHPGHCWGYNYREVRGGTSLSVHAAGCAIDINAPAHPLGKRGTFTDTQVAEIQAIIREVQSVVRWGGSFTNRADEMHFEICASPVEVAAVASRLLAQSERSIPKGEAVTHIPIKVSRDRTFRTAFMAECGTGSQIIDRAWVTLGSTWGNTTMTLGFVDTDGKVLFYKENIIVRNNHKVFFEAPSGTAIATVEGTAQFETTIPVVALVSKQRG